MTDPAQPESADPPNPRIDQSGQTVQGPQTNIAGNVYGPVLSGTFYGPVHVGDIVQHIQTLHQYVTEAEKAARNRATELKYLEDTTKRYLNALREAVEKPPSATPFKRLLDYQLNEAAIFFGRATAIQELGEYLNNARLAVLHSESGAGKTSLLRAGLAPRLLIANHMPVYVRALETNPALAIKRVFLPEAGLVAGLEATPLRYFLQQVSEVLGPQITLVIFLDQFEEFFAYLDETAQTAFGLELAQCLDDPALNVRWLLALRTEYYGRLSRLGRFVKRITDNALYLNHFTTAEAETVIEELARHYQFSVEPGLTQMIWSDLGGKDIIAPEMQLVYAALYEAVKPQLTLTRAVYERVGRAQGILHGHLYRVVGQDIAGTDNAAAWQILRALVTSEHRRALLTYDALRKEIGSDSNQTQVLEIILARLVDAGLVWAKDTETGLAYELVHDYLAEKIELDATTVRLKHVKELLAEGLRNWRRSRKLLLGPGQLNEIREHQTALNLDDESLELLVRSAVVVGQAVNDWAKQLSLGARQHLIQALITEGRDRDDVVRRNAQTALWALRAHVPLLNRPRLYISRLFTESPRLAAGGSLVLTGLVLLPLMLVFFQPADTKWQRMTLANLPVTFNVSHPVIAVDPFQPNRIYLAGASEGLYRLADGRWIELTTTLWHDRPVLAMGAMSQTVYISVAEGLFISEDEGQQWARRESLPQTLQEEGVSALAVLPQDPSTAYIAGQGTALFVTRNSGITWEPAASLGTSILSLATNGQVLLAGTLTRLVSGTLSADGTVAWSNTSFTGCVTPNESAPAVVMPDPGRGNFLAVADGGAKLCDGDVYNSTTILFEPSLLTNAARSLAASGRNIYLGTPTGVLCRRVWQWQQPEWWQWKLFRTGSCQP